MYGISAEGKGITHDIKTDISGNHRSQQWSNRVGRGIHGIDFGRFDPKICREDACGEENIYTGRDGGLRHSFWWIL